MNYYEHHLGDYAKDTGHLTMLEHGAYRTLLDRYYSTEQGIPENQAYRLARARSEEECRAVDVILEEFFELVDGVWVQHRVEHEIELARKRITAAQENGKKGGRPRKKPIGSDSETQVKPTGLSVGSDSETQVKAHHLPSTHLPIKPKAAASQVPTSQGPPETDAAPPSGSKNSNPEPDPVHLRAIELTALLRQRGAALQASDPRLRRWAETGVTDAQALAALETAQQRRESSGSAAAINAGYLDSILADIVAAKSPPKAGGKPALDDWYRSDAGIDRKGRELNMFARGGESYAAFRDRIWQRIRETENNPQEVDS